MNGQHKKIPKLHEYTAEQDIRYKGPLSYPGLMILGWLMIVFTAVRILLSALSVTKLSPETFNTVDSVTSVLEYLRASPCP